jgi:hypothetical protein
VGFVVDKVALGQVFPPAASVFPCQFHSTGAPLLGKIKKELIIFLSSSSQGCPRSLKAAVRPYLLLRGTSPQKKNNTTVTTSDLEHRLTFVAFT